jgi:hypothetical protein
MQLRRVFAVAGFTFVVPAYAGEVLKPFEAKQFVAGKLFSYTRFEGTTGAGRINADGSVVGTIRIRGAGPVHHVSLPVGTVKVSETGVCASMRGVSMQPCFDVQRVNAQSFRGSISGFGFAYCEFTRQHPRLRFASDAVAPAPVKPVERSVSLAPPQPSAVQSAEVKDPVGNLRLRSSTSQ